ncbi:ligase-associated DNA damage response DEXH box helicase [uncultured Comamonas sp.]|uniref:ligase-associated DNA damage response DEXH box helicase n=1 Tax=uncultured Comamonas sp. TaxID=114710 RepID=UPI003749E1C4
MAELDHSLAPSDRAMQRAAKRWRDWLKEQDIGAAVFQQQAWRAYADGHSGLISAPTGRGKTLAALGGPLMQAMAEAETPEGRASHGPRMLWVTPLRALASDTRERITGPVAAVLPHWQVAMRTGDATSRDKRLTDTGKAQLVVITPESLALLLSHERSREQFSQLRCIVVDEWHELLPSKRGVLLQLNLARIQALAPQAQVWGLSATIGNLQEASDVLLSAWQVQAPALIQDMRPKPFHLHSITPPLGTRMPWAGHLGLANLGEVAKLVFSAPSTIVFTNTRAQAELWHTALASIWPEDAETLAIHHGSLDQGVRQSVEQRLRAGTLRCVVATSSLDLGVDFPAVERVIQIGGARSVARMVQRAGRAKHRPGAAVHVEAVATQAMDLAEFAAVRELAEAQVYERREPLRLCFDVLSQHAMSAALAGGFRPPELLAEVRRTAAFCDLSDAQWQAVLAFLEHGSDSLVQYPQYERLHCADGLCQPANTGVVRMHRMSIGTITAHGAVNVQYLRGARLGSVEEAFIARLSPGDVFNFAGRSLVLVRLENQTAWVRRSAEVGLLTPAWAGSLMPMSSSLGERMQQLLSSAAASPAADDAPHARELQWLQPLLQLQSQRSLVPGADQLLIEQVGNTQAAKAAPLFVYPFAGRVAHEGLAVLIATRLAHLQANTFAWACNEIGLMIQPTLPIDANAVDWAEIFQLDGLDTDLRSAVNFSELARKRFKEIAQIAGLVQSKVPGKKSRASDRQLQVSASLLFDVLSNYDPEHLLLRQARQEALDQELHLPTMQRLLASIAGRQMALRFPARHTPFSFGLWAESFRGQLSNETWQDKVRRMAAQQERQAAGEPGPRTGAPRTRPSRSGAPSRGAAPQRPRSKGIPPQGTRTAARRTPQLQDRS